ncbi:MAG: serine/threonine-protein kinase, partial [Eubacteriales bacterium]|nr:serine/threonine-protein kinase [Eubacteriales bacterium]
MADDRFRKYEPFFGKWKIDKPLGKGSFAQVYQISWEDDLGGKMVSALKCMHVPSDEELRVEKERQPDMDAVRSIFQKKVERIKDEIRIMQRCKGHANIVGYEDHMIVEDVGPDRIGWDIMIRMEILYPIKQVFSERNRQASQFDVMKLWLDISNALIFCDDQKIIHRDIKPQNILISADGRYKLTDFGVAKKVFNNDASTRVGTEHYMAPEVSKKLKYDKRADYYAIGRVVYYLLNHRRHAFLPPYPLPIDADSDDYAEHRRIVDGEKIPPLANTTKEVNDLMQKALAYKPEKRFKDAREMYDAVLKVMRLQEAELRASLLYVTPEQRENSTYQTSKAKSSVVQGTTTKSVGASTESSGKKNGSSNRLLLPIALAGVMVVVGTGGLIYGLKQNSGQKETESEQTEPETVAAYTESGENGLGLLGKMNSEQQTESLAETETESQTTEAQTTETETE